MQPQLSQTDCRSYQPTNHGTVNIYADYSIYCQGMSEMLICRERQSSNLQCRVPRQAKIADSRLTWCRLDEDDYVTKSHPAKQVYIREWHANSAASPLTCSVGSARSTTPFTTSPFLASTCALNRILTVTTHWSADNALVSRPPRTKKPWYSRPSSSLRVAWGRWRSFEVSLRIGSEFSVIDFRSM